MVSFVQISSPRDQSQESLHLCYPLMLWVYFPQINKHSCQRKQAARWMQWYILGPAFETCSSFFLGWSTVSLLDSCGQRPCWSSPPISEGPSGSMNPAHGYPALLKAPFISVGTASWMPLPDHLSPLAWGSGDTCGFNIMHRCDLGEENYSCGLTSAGVTGLWNRGGQEGGEAEKTSRQPQAL